MPPNARNVLTSLVDSGALAIVAMTIISVEILVMWFKRAPARAAFAANGMSGIMILAALGFSLSGCDAHWIAAALGLSLVAHIVYLVALRRS